MRSLHPTHVAVVAALLLAGCQTRAEVKSQPSDAGVGASYSAPVDKVRQAARDVVGAAEFTVREEGDWDGRWRLLASQGLASGTVGRIVRVVVKPGDPVSVYVLVRSKLDTEETRVADDALAKEMQDKLAARLH